MVYLVHLFAITSPILQNCIDYHDGTAYSKCMTTKAFAYLRVSGRGQIDGDGFDRQLLSIQNYAASANIKIAKVFKEEGISGTVEGMDRPAWIDMIAAVMANGVKTIIIEKLDRLARDLMIQEHIVQDMQRRGITLVSVAEPDLCSDDPTRKLLRQIMGAIAEYDKSMIVLKLRGARTRARGRNGHCEGRKAFGHNEWEPDIILRMQLLRDQGLGYDAIAAKLNADKIPTRTGSKWYGTTVHKILARRAKRLI